MEKKVTIQAIYESDKTEQNQPVLFEDGWKMDDQDTKSYLIHLKQSVLHIKEKVNDYLTLQLEKDHFTKEEINEEEEEGEEES
jgi:hypothetical protein